MRSGSAHELRDGVILATTSLLISATSSAAQATLYEWTISTSSTDPFVHSAEVTGGVATFYLWLACCNPAEVEGMSAAEFDIVSTGPLHLATTPRNGFLNAGSTTYLMLAVGSCPCGPVVAAELVVFANVSGTLGLAPSAAGGVKGTADCEPVPTLHAIEWRGVGVGVPAEGKGNVGDCGITGHCPRIYCNPDGSCYEIWCSYPCDCPIGVNDCSDCEVTSVEDTSWGRTKSLYR